MDWLLGPAPSPFADSPAGISFRDDNLYICDTGRAMVHRWNLATGEAWKIGAESLRFARIVRPDAAARERGVGARDLEG